METIRFRIITLLKLVNFHINSLGLKTQLLTPHQLLYIILHSDLCVDMYCLWSLGYWSNGWCSKCKCLQWHQFLNFLYCLKNLMQYFMCNQSFSFYYCYHQPYCNYQKIYCFGFLSSMVLLSSCFTNTLHHVFSNFLTFFDLQYYIHYTYLKKVLLLQLIFIAYCIHLLHQFMEVFQDCFLQVLKIHTLLVSYEFREVVDILQYLTGQDYQNTLSFNIQKNLLKQAFLNYKVPLFISCFLY